MKNFILIPSLLILVTGCSAVKEATRQVFTPAKYQKSDVIENEFVFKGDRQVVENYLRSMNVQNSMQEIVPGTNLYQVQLKGSHSIDNVISGLDGQVEYAEPNFKVKLNASADKYSWPNDKLFFKQWGMNNIGQNAPFGLPGTEGADIDILKTWATLNKGSKETVVAVIDTGIDYTHPDLKANMWVNTKESEQGGGVAGKDDDGNGLIDDVYGYDFYSASRNANKFGAPGDNDPMDEDGHGTHCAGTIGAVSNNAQGIVGINQNVRLMALRFLGAGGGNTVDAVRAIYYAIKKEAHVMSNSWGGSGDSKLLRSAIADAQKAGILFVAAAGNDGINIDVKPSYPAGMDLDNNAKPLTNLVSVGASDNQDNPAEFSNYGHQKVHLFAPGVQIISTYPVALAPARPYAVMSGTSMAAPYVSGVAALLISHQPRLKGKPEEIRNILMQTVDTKESLIGKAASNGRLNATRALQTTANNALKFAWLGKNQSISQKGFNRDLVDIRHEIKVPQARAIRVHFDFIQIEEPYDSLYLYDRNLRLIAQVEDTQTRDHWSAVIPGDAVTIRYTNSLVRQVTMGMAQPQESEAACMSLGAEEVIQKGNKFMCQVDSEDSGSSKVYSTFNSEGFSVDRIEYLAQEGGKK